MMTSLLSREDRLIRIDPREADDLIALLGFVEIPSMIERQGRNRARCVLPLPSTAGDAELGRAEAILLEFNRMRSTRDAPRAG